MDGPSWRTESKVPILWPQVLRQSNCCLAGALVRRLIESASDSTIEGGEKPREEEVGEGGGSSVMQINYTALNRIDFSFPSPSHCPQKITLLSDEWQHIRHIRIPWSWWTCKSVIPRYLHLIAPLLWHVSRQLAGRVHAVTIAIKNVSARN